MPFKDRVGFGKIRFARWMHRHPTPSEAALWERLKGRQLGVTFLSQECILGYIADFYCPAAQLVIELDGSSHDSPQGRASDAERDAAFERHKISVLRLASESSPDDQVARIERKLQWLRVARDKPAAA
jgi:very-short-patch-repair endonuclease